MIEYATENSYDRCYYLYSTGWNIKFNTLTEIMIIIKLLERSRKSDEASIVQLVTIFVR